MLSLQTTAGLEYPGDCACTFFECRDFGCSSQTVDTGCATTYTYSPGSFGNKISSFECGKNIRYEFHNHNSPSTGYEIVSGAGHLRGPQLEHWMEDRVTSVKMDYYDQWTQGSATVWGWTDCRDIGAELQGPSVVGDVNYYTGSMGWAMGIKEKEMESF